MIGFVVGKVTTITKTEQKHYPLFLFNCENVDSKKQIVDVEATGFINFWIDNNVYDNEISKKFGNSITINRQFVSLVQNMQHYLKHKDFATNLYDDVKFDYKYSSVGTITGFEPEYIDPVWDRIPIEQ